MEASKKRKKNGLLFLLTALIGLGFYSARALGPLNSTFLNTKKTTSKIESLEIQVGDEPRAPKLTANLRSKRPPKASRNLSSTENTNNEILSAKECQGQKIVLENKRVLSNETIGSAETCEITLPPLSYIKIKGKVILLAKKIYLYGVVNGNASGTEKDAATLDTHASSKTIISGSIELRGNFAFSESKGGALNVKSPEIKAIGQINLQGARKELNGQFSYDCSSCNIQHQNILYSNQVQNEISLTDDAREINELASHLRKFREELKKNSASETIVFSYLQRTKLLKSRIKKFESRIEKSIDEELKAIAIKNNLDQRSLLRSNLASRLFKEKAFSYIENTDNAIALIKDFEIFTLSKKLKSVDNFDPHAWGLNADESYLLESKVMEIKNRTQEIYDTQAT